MINYSISPSYRDAACIGGLLQVADSIRREISPVFKPLGLTGQQYNVLRILRGAHPEPLPTLQLAARLLEQTPGITRLLDRLEHKALVTRQRTAADRRQVVCSVTAVGLELLKTLDKAVEDANARVLEPLTEAERATLLGLLGALTTNEQAQPPRGA